MGIKCETVNCAWEESLPGWSCARYTYKLRKKRARAPRRGFKCAAERIGSLSLFLPCQDSSSRWKFVRLCRTITPQWLWRKNSRGRNEKKGEGRERSFLEDKESRALHDVRNIKRGIKEMAVTYAARKSCSRCCNSRYSARDDARAHRFALLSSREKKGNIFFLFHIYISEEDETRLFFNFLQRGEFTAWLKNLQAFTASITIWNFIKARRLWNSMLCNYCYFINREYYSEVPCLADLVKNNHRAHYTIPIKFV